jgi:hypothetical protein
MRILVTNNGKIEIKNIIDKNNVLNESNEQIKENNNNKEHKIKRKKNISKSVSEKVSNKLKTIIKFNQNNLYENVMKEMFELYMPEKLYTLKNYLFNDEISEKKRNLINYNLNNNIIKKKPKEEIQKEKTIPLGKIIKLNAYNKIIKDFKKDNYVYQKNFVLNINNFRTKEELSNINLLNKSLNKKIDVTKFDFIKYLKNKNNLGYNFLNKISKMNDIEIDKLNRVAQSKKFNILEKSESKYLFDRKKFHNYLKKKNHNEINDINDNIMNKTQIIFSKFNKKELIKNEFLNNYYKEKTLLISRLPNLSKSNKKIHNKSSINFYKKLEC